MLGSLAGPHLVGWHVPRRGVHAGVRPPSGRQRLVSSSCWIAVFRAHQRRCHPRLAPARRAAVQARGCLRRYPFLVLAVTISLRILVRKIKVSKRWDSPRRCRKPGGYDQVRGPARVRRGLSDAKPRRRSCPCRRGCSTPSPARPLAGWSRIA
jgi:hypothetical protein